MLLLLLLLLQVRLHTDKATGKSRGYAHVHFADEAGLDRWGRSDSYLISSSARTRCCMECWQPC
jgi:hypothetical protein